MNPKRGGRFSDQIMRDELASNMRRITRRTVIGLLASAPFLATRGEAREAAIPRLIKAAQSYPTVAGRIDFISRSLLGVRYRGHTLVGGPQQPEIFVLRDDAFDCVTYCEAVLSAAIARDYPGYAEVLKRIRYSRGEVRWAERNHDFAQWSRSVVANKVCRPVDITPSVTLNKRLTGDELGWRQYEFTAVAISTLLANQKALQPGDIVGFVSRRPSLDFFHVGFLTFDKRRTLMLRHASRSYGRVLDEDMGSFVFRTGVRYVTLLRTEEPPPELS